VLSIRSLPLVWVGYPRFPKLKKLFSYFLFSVQTARYLIELVFELRHTRLGVITDGNVSSRNG
jgi:hypothetical protein